MRPGGPGCLHSRPARRRAGQRTTPVAAFESAHHRAEGLGDIEKRLAQGWWHPHDRVPVLAIARRQEPLGDGTVLPLAPAVARLGTSAAGRGRESKTGHRAILLNKTLWAVWTSLPCKISWRAWPARRRCETRTAGPTGAAGTRAEAPAGTRPAPRQAEPAPDSIRGLRAQHRTARARPAIRRSAVPW